MPALSSRGGMSARAYGMFSRVLPPMPAGDYGLYAQGSNTTGTIAYQFSNDALFVTPALNRNLGSSNAGVGNGVAGIFASGGSGTPGSALTTRYGHATATMTNGASLAGNLFQGGACGNSTLGLFALGGSTASPNTSIYTYANDTAAGGAALLRNVNWTSMQGDSAHAVISANSTSGNNALTTQYAYASNATQAGTSFPIARTTGGSSCGNATKGIFMRTNTSGSLTQKYTYAGDTTAAGGGLAQNQSNIGQGAGNATVGVTPCGSNALTNKYTYSSDTAASGTSFSASYNFGAAVSNNIAGVNA